MGKKSVLAIGIVLTFLCIIVTASCNKTEVDSNTTTCTDNALAEIEFLRPVLMINTIMLKASEAKGVARVLSGGYPNITVGDTTQGWPRTLTIDYGPGVVDSSDGRTRSGIITIVLSNYWHDNNSTATITYTNYCVNSINYKGTVVLTRNSDSIVSEEVQNGICAPSGVASPILYACSTVFTWMQGAGDSTLSHSVYSIGGSVAGTDRNKVNYTVTISKSLIRSGSCGYITQGTEVITPAGLAIRTVDYGSGNCDNLASVTINGNSFPITLQ
jgi:hypothetical protein